MRRQPSVESPPSPSSSLHPVLQTALGSLDIKLTDELARYRRMRGRYPRQTPPAPSGVSDRQPDLAAATAAAVAAATAATAATTATAAHRTQAAYGAMPEGSGAIADGVRPAIPPLDVAQTPQTEPLAGPDLSKVSHDFQPPTGETALPDGYLESSEELLKSLSEEEAQLRAEEDPGLLQTLLTPLGIGSMMLLLLSSVTFGYLLTNPDSFKQLGLDRLLGERATPELSVSPIPSPEGSTLPAGPDLTNQEFVDLNLETLSRVPSGVPQVAVPADPTTVDPTTVTSTASALTTGASTTGATGGASTATTPRSAPATAPAGAPSSSAASSPSGQRAASNASRPAAGASRDRSDTAAAAPRRPAPTRPAAPAPAAPPRQAAPAQAANPPQAPRPAAPAPSSAPVQESLYYVVTNYSGDRSLDQARSAVGDAYVRNYASGARVQMGAFSERSRAEELRQQLQQQGIDAEIYQP